MLIKLSLLLMLMKLSLLLMLMKLSWLLMLTKLSLLLISMKVVSQTKTPHALLYMPDSEAKRCIAGRIPGMSPSSVQPISEIHFV